jgi:hypothetical protein
VRTGANAAAAASAHTISRAAGAIFGKRSYHTGRNIPTGPGREFVGNTVDTSLYPVQSQVVEQFWAWAHRINIIQAEHTGSALDLSAMPVLTRTRCGVLMGSSYFFPSKQTHFLAGMMR